MSSEREYEVVLFGATGYTGKYCAEHIATHLPTDLRWAVAGRNESKLTSVVNDIKSLNTDRLSPTIEVCSLDLQDLNILARKTKLIINTVGPYHLYGTNVIEACAKNGTHYLDTTAESPWVLEMIQKYDSIAKANNAIIIPQIGFESAASDMLTYSLVHFIRETLGVGTAEVIATMHELQARPSGGTFATALGLFDHYTLSEFLKSTEPWALSPLPGKEPLPTPLLTKIFGVRTVPDLGMVSTAVSGGPNRTIVGRSWGVIDAGNYYGPHFRYSEYATVGNRFIGAAIHVGLVIAMAALTMAPIRWFLKKLVFSPGQGPTKEETSNDLAEYRGIATADSPKHQRAFSKMQFKGSMYQLTAIYLTEGARVLLRGDGKTTAQKIGGGFLTPATLGQPYIECLSKAGLVMETHWLDR